MKFGTFEHRVTLLVEEYCYIFKIYFSTCRQESPAGDEIEAGAEWPKAPHFKH